MLFNNGIIIGKFMPFHKGHEFLIRFGMKQCKKLTVIVDHSLTETIDQNIRVEWIQNTFPNINVYTFKNFMPQDPSETELFWEIWKKEIQNIVNPDVLFASEDYGVQLSNVLKCEFIPCDIERKNIFISATKIRNDILNNFDYLNFYAKKYFAKEFVFIGPESTYKTSISKILQDKFNKYLLYIPEAAENYIKMNKIEQIEKRHLDLFVNLQISLYESMVETNIKPIIIQDSNLITTAVYYKLLFNELPTEIENNIKYENNKIYFLFKNDNKFIEDTHRIISKEEEFRNKWFSVCEDFLKHYNITYIIVEGNFKQKEEKIMNYFSSII